MRKLKLLLASLAIVVGGVIPVSAAQTPVADGIYYLYNANANKFLSHRDYGALGVPCVDDFGVPVQLVADGDNFKIKFYDHKESGGQTVYLAGQYWCSAWDQTGAVFSLTIVDSEVPSYKIHNATNWSGNANQYVYYSLSTVTGEEYRLAANSADGLNLKEEGQIVWQFLSKAEYDAKMAEYVNATYTSVLSSANRNDIDASTFIATMEGDNWARKDLTSKIGTATFSGSIGSWAWSQWRSHGGQPAYGTNYCEIFQATGNLTQTVTGLDEGIYKVTVQGFERAGSNADCVTFGAAGYDNVSTFLEANGQRVKFASWYSDRAGDANPNGPSEGVALFNNNKYVNEVYTYVGSDGKLDITVSVPKFVINRWVLFNNFTLTYYSDAVSDDDATEILTTATGLESKIMQASLKEELTSAKSTFDGARTIVNYNALSAAITAAQTSIAAYASAKTVLDQINAYLTAENTYCNLYTTEAYNTYYADILTAYNNRTLTTDAANAVSYGTRVSGNLPAILLSSWKVGEQTAIAAGVPYINTWSVEGNTDGSEFYTPFYEYWVSSGNVLAAKTFTSTITGLEANATYSVTIRARVQPTDNQTMIDNAIMMQVGSGDAVCISGGAKFGTTSYYIGNFSAVGTTDAEGNLVTTITVAENSNVSWLAFYNVRYTEGEDLSAYIADYQFALSNVNTIKDSPMDPAKKTAIDAALGSYGSIDTENTTKAMLISAKDALETAYNAAVPSIASFAGTSATGWTKSETNGSLQANTWSTEGNTDGSNMTTTFLQVHQGKENGGLADNVITYAMTGETQGYYKVTALVRVLNEKDASVSPKGAFIYANDNIERAYGDNATVCTNGVYGNPVVYGYVGEDGNLNVGFKLIGTNCNWISWKNLKIEYVGTTLTSEIAANQTEEARTFENLTTGAAAAQTAAVNALSTLSNDNYTAAGQAIEAAYKAIDREFSALQAAITAKADAVLGFEAGEYAPYNLVAPLAAAKAIDQTSEASTQEEINTATTNLTAVTANAAEVNAFGDPDFSKSGNDAAMLGWQTSSSAGLGGAQHARAFVLTSEMTNYNYLATFSEGETRSAAYMRFDGVNSGKDAVYTYGATEGYTMPLKATAYLLTAQFGGWGQVDKDVTFVITKEDGTQVATKTLRTPSTGVHAGGSAIALNLLFVTPEAGNYKFQIKNTNTSVDNAIAISNLELKKAVAENVTIAETVEYTPVEKYANVTFNRTLVEGWNGLVLPFDMSVADAETTFNASKVKDFSGITYTEGSGVTLNFEDATEIKAGRPFLLKVGANPASSYTIDGVILSSDALQTVEQTAEGNDNIKYTMTGTYAATTDLTDVSFALINGTKFYYHTAGVNSSSAKAFRAYFVNSSTEAAAEESARVSFNFGDGDVTTAISEVKAQTADSEAIYNLGGQRVQKAQKGLYIQNGKKVVVK